MGLPDSEHIGKIADRPARLRHRLRRRPGPALERRRRPRRLQDHRRRRDLGAGARDQPGHRRHRGLVVDPRDPDVLYAASYQRRRHVWTLIDGGPESGHLQVRPTAARPGASSPRACPWRDMGRIGLAVSPVDPDVVYAIIEAADDAGGFFRSTDRGESWEQALRLRLRQPAVLPGAVPRPGGRRPGLLDGHVHDGHRPTAAPPYHARRRERQARRQPRPLDRPDRRRATWSIGNDGGLYESFDAAARPGASCRTCR